MTEHTQIAAASELLSAYVPYWVQLVGVIIGLLTVIYGRELKKVFLGRGSNQKSVRVHKKVVETTYFR